MIARMATYVLKLVDTPSHPRGAFRPSLAPLSLPLQRKGAGKAGCRLAPTVRCARVAQANLHSGIQVKPNTRPSLRDGRTAYAVLSREPSSFWPPSPSRNSPTPRRLTRLPPPQELDRSNDGQDHTVLPYARPAMSPQYFQPRRRSCETYRRDEPNSAARLHEAAGSQGLPALPAPSRADAAASTASPARDQDDLEIAPPG